MKCVQLSAPTAAQSGFRRVATGKYEAWHKQQRKRAHHGPLFKSLELRETRTRQTYVSNIIVHDFYVVTQVHIASCLLSWTVAALRSEKSRGREGTVDKAIAADSEWRKAQSACLGASREITIIDKGAEPGALKLELKHLVACRGIAHNLAACR